MLLELLTAWVWHQCPTHWDEKSQRGSVSAEEKGKCAFVLFSTFLPTLIHISSISVMCPFSRCRPHGFYISCYKASCMRSALSQLLLICTVDFASCTFCPFTDANQSTVRTIFFLSWAQIWNKFNLSALCFDEILIFFLEISGIFLSINKY